MLSVVLPGIGAIIGISVLVTAVGGIAEDGVLTVVGVATLVVSTTLAAYVVVARRRKGQACAVEELRPETVTEPSATTPVATRTRHV